jgi:hypothetical protein
MAVRNFDLTEPQSSRLTALESAPLRRQDLRRTKQRFMVIAIVSLTVPFAAALVVLGVVR